MFGLYFYKLKVEASATIVTLEETPKAVSKSLIMASMLSEF
jgi:hypothetical protein